jgi:all-trans-retinol dehydrogenase (NAD+)
MNLLSENIKSFICDVSDYSQVQAIAKQIEEEVGTLFISRHYCYADLCLTASLQVGRPTILVNNAGVVTGKLLLDLTEEDIKR